MTSTRAPAIHVPQSLTTAVLLCAVTAATALAQATTPTALVPGTGPQPATMGAIVCAPHLIFSSPTSTLRVTGAQSSVNRLVFGPGDTLVIDGGSAAGVQAGTEYLVRRLPRRFGSRPPDREHPGGVHTAGWIRILGVGERLSTATIVHACDGIQAGDYLEPFEAPPALAESPAARVQYGNYGKIISGDEDKAIGGSNDFMLIDRGSDHGVAAGDAIVILRDRQSGTPLVEVGEGIVMSVGPESSTVRLTKARDAIMTGDLVAVKK